MRCIPVMNRVFSVPILAAAALLAVSSAAAFAQDEPRLKEAFEGRRVAEAWRAHSTRAGRARAGGRGVASGARRAARARPAAAAARGRRAGGRAERRGAGGGWAEAREGGARDRRAGGPAALLGARR